MTSNHHALMIWATRATMDNTKGSETARSSKSHKVVLSSDCSLQLDYMKLESLVIVDQHATVNTFPVLYTPPVTPREFVTPEAGGVTFGASRRRWDK